MQSRVVVLSVDVEEDMPGWRVSPHISVDNVHALPRLQAICDRYAVPPTYLVTYPMVTSHDSRRVLTDLHRAGTCEIGAHLHPWNTPPLPNGPETVPVRANHLPRALVAARLETLTETITAAFGERPRSFRFGRFGVDGPCLIALERLEYQVDSSVTPGISWRHEGGPDFRDAPVFPYRPSRLRPDRPGNSRLVEVPVGAGFTRRLPNRVRKLYLHLPRWTRIRGLLSRDHLDWVEYLWLSPWGHPPALLKRVVDDLIAREVPLIHLFLHSSELVPGASGYARTMQEVDRLLETLEAVLAHAVERWGCRGVTLSQFAAWWAASPGATGAPGGTQ